MGAGSDGIAARAGAPQPGRPVPNRLPGKWIDFGMVVAIWLGVEFVVVKVVPVFTDIFSQFGGRLPAPTRLIMQLSRFPGSAAIPVMLACLVVFQCWRSICMPPPMPGDFRLSWDRKLMVGLFLLGVAVFLLTMIFLYAPIGTLGDQAGP